MIKSNQLTNDQSTVPVAVAALAIDWSEGNIFTKSISVDSTFTFANANDGQTLIVQITNTDASNDRELTFPTCKWVGGEAITTIVQDTITIYTFIKIGSDIIANASLEIA